MRCGFLFVGRESRVSFSGQRAREYSLGREGTFAEQVYDRCRGLYLGK